MSVKSFKLFEQIAFILRLFQWLVVASLIGSLVGVVSAGFLILLDWVTNLRETHQWILIFLPTAGFLMGWVYHRFGKPVEKGSQLIFDEIHTPQKIIPLRMAPLVLVGTLMTHLFGGSAGREGTAVQMGASLADQFSLILKWFRLERRILLMAGMSAGFASVFGTPLAGTIFGLEVLMIGKLHYRAIFPCLLAAFVGDQVTQALGIHHTTYLIPVIPQVSIGRICFAAIAGICFGLTARVFSQAIHRSLSLFQKVLSYAPLRPLVGGIFIVLGVWILGTTRYVGLGIPVMIDSFAHSLPPWDFLAKLIFTVVTLGSGFKGGEVTPLFFIGATLGNALALFLPLPFSLLAGMGFVAVFAGASHAPIASVLMAIELFGVDIAVYAVIACILSCQFSGQRGIYTP